MATVARMRRQGRPQGSEVVEARRVGGLATAGLLATALVSGIAVLLAGLGVPAGATNSHVQTIHVSTAKVPNVGTVLTTGAGLTLYRYTANPAGTNTCTGGCAKLYPPYFASKGAHIDGPKGVKGLSVMNVGGGHWQVAFHKVALYRFVGDKKKGQAKAQGLGNVWFAVLKSGIPAAAPAAQTPTTSAPTTQATTSTTQSSHAGTTTPPTSSQTPAQTPTTQAPAPTTQPTSPPTTTPPTSPPTTTPTTTGGGGGVGF